MRCPNCNSDIINVSKCIKQCPFCKTPLIYVEKQSAELVENTRKKFSNKFKEAELEEE